MRKRPEGIATVRRAALEWRASGENDDTDRHALRHPATPRRAARRGILPHPLALGAAATDARDVSCHAAALVSWLLVHTLKFMPSPFARPPSSRIRATLRSLGVLNGWLYLLSRVLARASFGAVRLVRYLIVAQPIGNAALRALRPDAATIIETIEPSHPMVAAFPRPCAVIRQRFANGATCFIATVRNTFAGFAWFQRESYDEDEVRCRYRLVEPRCSVWDFDVYVEPNFRLGRTLARLWQVADAQLAQQGVIWSFSRISAFNAESLASHARLGIVDCAHATFLCIGPLQLALLSMRPFVHLSFSAGRQPVLSLAPPR